MNNNNFLCFVYTYNTQPNIFNFNYIVTYFNG